VYLYTDFLESVALVHLFWMMPLQSNSQGCAPWIALRVAGITERHTATDGSLVPQAD